METINFIRITAKNDINTLKAHIRYLQRETANPYTQLSSERIWEERAKYEKAKRYDARIALTLVIAIPNDRHSDVHYFEELREFIAKFFNVDLNHIDYVVHRDNPNNIHMHAIVYPRKIDTKKVDTKISDLKRLHREHEAFLKQHGYTVKYDDISLGHIGHKDPKTLEMYKEKKRLELEIKEMVYEYGKRVDSIRRTADEVEAEISRIRATANRYRETDTTETANITSTQPTHRTAQPTNSGEREKVNRIREQIYSSVEGLRKLAEKVTKDNDIDIGLREALTGIFKQYQKYSQSLQQHINKTVTVKDTIDNDTITVETNTTVDIRNLKNQIDNDLSNVQSLRQRLTIYNIHNTINKLNTVKPKPQQDKPTPKTIPKPNENEMINEMINDEVNMLLQYYYEIQRYTDIENRDSYFINSVINEMNFQYKSLIQAIAIIKQINDDMAERYIKGYLKRNEDKLKPYIDEDKLKPRPP